MNKKNKTSQISRSEFRMMKMVDAEQLLYWSEENDPRYQHYTFTDYNINDIQNWYSIKQKMIKRKLYGFFVDGIQVGFTTLKKIDCLQRTAEIGLAIDPAKRSRGYGEAMLYELLDYVYLHFPIDTIYLEVADFNYRARSLYEKLGFMYEGTWNFRAYESQNRNLVHLYPEDFFIHENFVMARVYRMSYRKVTIRVDAPAKINLGLLVGERQENGYHELASAMQTVSLFDRVYVRRSTVSDGKAHYSVDSRDKSSRRREPFVDISAELGRLSESKENAFSARILSQHEGIPAEKNLAYIAAQKLFEHCPFPPIDISIDKQIPEGAGLGGGSADAAATLVGIKILYSLEVSDQDLERIALEVGSDVPFCLRGGFSAVFGRGEIFEQYLGRTLYMNLYTIPVKTRTSEVFVLLDEVRASDGQRATQKNKIGNSREEMAHARDAVREFCGIFSSGATVEEIVQAIPGNDLERPAEIYISQDNKNTFKEVLLKKVVEESGNDLRRRLKENSLFTSEEELLDSMTICSVKEEFLSNGALYSAMSGSGSTVYAIFSDMESAKRCADKTGAIFVETIPARSF